MWAHGPSANAERPAQDTTAAATEFSSPRLRCSANTRLVDADGQRWYAAVEHVLLVATHQACQRRTHLWTLRRPMWYFGRILEHFAAFRSFRSIFKHFGATIEHVTMPPAPSPRSICLQRCPSRIHGRTPQTPTADGGSVAESAVPVHHTSCCPSAKRGGSEGIPLLTPFTLLRQTSRQRSATSRQQYVEGPP